MSQYNQKLMPRAAALSVGIGLALGSMGVAAQEAPEGEQQATTLDRIEVTGSRIKRADIEGSLPVTVIDRVQLEASGDVSVADFLRNTTFNSFGSFQSNSGFAAAGFSGVSLRGLGANRTLILVDGRRAPTSPTNGQAQDLNSIPMAAVERVEILSDGASAIYGSDALGGVINVILRKDFEGLEMTYGLGRPTNPGGDTEEMNILMGTSGERGNILFGASYNKREVIMTRDRDYWFSTPGASTYSNNFSVQVPDGAGGFSRPAALGNAGRLRHPEWGSAVPGLCTNGDDSDLFWLSGANSDNFTCQFNHSATSANLTAVENTSVFARGEYEINDNWLAYFSTSVSKVETFGRFAAVPSSPWPGGAILLPVGSPNHPATAPEDGGFNPNWDDPYYQTGSISIPQFDQDGNPIAPIVQPIASSDLLLYHRFAALGERDNFSENTTSDFHGGVEGRVGNVDVNVGARYVEARATNVGYNYVVGGLAQQHITGGSYNIYDPFAGDPNALGFTATTNRDMKTSVKEFYGSAAFDLFDMAGGIASAAVGAEYREEYYQDIYDQLSAAGQIVGSSGSSASGDRTVSAAFVEVLLPVFDRFEIDFAGRYDKYSDYGADFAPKVAVRYQPLDNVTLRASYGEGFRAPTLDILSQQPSFGAAATGDPATCQLLTGTSSCNTQVTTYSIANPALESEQSEQFSLGVVWDATDWLNLTLDYYNITINNQIANINMATVVGCLRGTTSVCPSGLSVFPQGTTLPNPALGLGAEFDQATGGIVNAQTGFANIGFLETDGYDLTARTNLDFGNLGRLRSMLTVSYVDNFSSNGNANIAGRAGPNGGSTPRARAGLNNNWSIGDWDFNWNISYTHSMQSRSYRQWLALTTLSSRSAQQESDLAFFANQPRKVPSWVINDIQVNYNAPWNATITLGVNNVADKDPVFDPAFGGAAYDTFLYDPWGRQPYFRYTQRF